jgi:hypothetical protein
MARLLDEALPAWEVDEVHGVWVPAPPEAAFAAARAVTVREVRLLVPLMALRLLPALLRGRRIRDDRSLPVLDAMVANGFVLLGERPPAEVAVGAVGRFWRLDAEDTLRALSGLAEFAAFAEPGFAKGATDLRVEPEGAGSRVTTETRVAATDDEAARLFRRYWVVIGAGSALIRLSWLNAIRRRVGVSGAEGRSG